MLNEEFKSYNQGSLVNFDCPSRSRAARHVVSASVFDKYRRFDLDKPADKFRKTHIICTLGPASHTIETLQELMLAGMDIVRLNFSHGTYDYHSDTIQMVREAERTLKPFIRPIAIALDTKGPEIRTGLVNGSPTGEAELCTGEIIRVTPDKAYYEHCNEKTLYVDYENIVRVLNVGSLIFIDDGLICVRVKEKGADYLDCVIENGGRLGSKKGVNLPGSPVDLPAMSEKDRQDILFAVNNNLDMIFASFIRDAKAIYEMRQLMGERGARIKIIAKIENHQGVKNINEIIDAADGIMVARGDLGIEIPPEKVFLVQKMCFERCNFVGKPCICATQMLESMTYKPRATRAESSDVANAVLDGADCVMLSGESAKGKYPVECVRTMSAICREAESVSSRIRPYNGLQSMTKLPAETNLGTAIAAVEASLSIAARAIICITSTGESSRMLSWHRPLCPILCVTQDPVAARQLNLFWGCIPILYEGKGADCWSEDVNRRIEYGINYGLQIGLLGDNDRIVVVTGWRSEPGHTNTVRIIQLGSFENHDVIGFPELKRLKY